MCLLCQAANAHDHPLVFTDANDRIASKTLGGQTVNYTYNSNNPLASTVDPLGGYTTDYTYDLQGHMIASQQSNGRTNRFSYTYDNMNRLTEQLSFVNNFTQGCTYIWQ